MTRVRAELAYDDEAHVWFVANSDCPGLNAEALTWDEAARQTALAAADLVEFVDLQLTQRSNPAAPEALPLKAGGLGGGARAAVEAKVAGGGGASSPLPHTSRAHPHPCPSPFEGEGSSSPRQASGERSG